jgi:hypothetical protein
MALIVLHPNNKNYIRYKLNRLEEEVEEMVEARRRAVQKGGGKIVLFADADADAEAEADVPLPKNMFIED